MSKIFKTNVNSQFDFDITSETISSLDIHKISNTKCHILHKNESYKTEIIEKKFIDKSYKVKVNNKHFNVLILNELDSLIKSMGFESGKSKHIDFIKAPMPGLIIDISVSIGQDVNENDPLLILEAMKMENIITSPRQGIIKYISINKGDAVEKNQLLIEFEK